MFVKFALIQFAILVNCFLTINTQCDNVKSVCDCQQSTSINNRTSIQCPKMYVGGRYTHYFEIIDQHRFKIDCIRFNPLNRIPKLYLGQPHDTQIEFVRCFNNDTRHANYQFDVAQFMDETLNIYVKGWNSIDVRFHDSGKVNETLFFSRWPQFRSTVLLKNIYTDTSAYLPRLYSAQHLSLINVNLVDFNKFIDNCDALQILKISDTKTVRNLNKRNLSKFRKLLQFSVENSYIEDYFNQVYKQGSVFEEILGIKEISLVATLTDKIELNATIFYRLTRLVSLKLIGLKLEELPHTIFKDLEALSYLELRHNKLSVLNKNIFDNCGKLVNIDLSFNSLVRIDTTIFAYLPALTVLNLRHNELKSFMYDASNHVSFKEIYLDHNHIQMDSFTCPIINIHHAAGIIDYSHNQIWRSEPILNCLITNPELRILKATHNQIHSLQFFKLFANQTAMHKNYVALHLQNNFIDSIDLLEYQLGSDRSASKDAGTNIVLHLDMNPIFCANCRYSNGLFVNGTSEIFVYHETVIKIPQPEICLKSIFCPVSNFVDHYACPDACYCTLNKYTSSLAINCQNTKLNAIPFLSNELLQGGINVNEIHLDLQNNSIASITFDKLVDDQQTSFDIIQKITQLNLEHNAIETLKLDHDHFPIALTTLRLASNKISNIDDTTLAWMNSLGASLSVSLGNNTITNDHRLYHRYVNRIEFIVVDREAISEIINNLKLAERIRDSQSNTVSIAVVSLVFSLVTIGLSYIGYVFHRKHRKDMAETQIQIQSETQLVSEPVTEMPNEEL